MTTVGFGSAACRFGSCLYRNKLLGNHMNCCISHRVRLVENLWANTSLYLCLSHQGLQDLSTFPWLPFLIGLMRLGYPHTVKMHRVWIYSLSCSGRSWSSFLIEKVLGALLLMTQVGCHDRSTSVLPRLGNNITSQVLLYLGGSYYGFLCPQWLSTNIY